MIASEEDAKLKWCPFVRAQYFQPPSEKQNPALNRPDWNDKCLGSACMAWHWQDLAKGTGYCGLAGHPVEFSGE